MDKKNTSIAKARVAQLLRVLRSRKADNFVVVGRGVWGNEGARTPWFRSKREKRS